MGNIIPFPKKGKAIDGYVLRPDDEATYLGDLEIGELIRCGLSMAISLDLPNMIESATGLGYVIFERIDRDDAELAWMEMKLKNTAIQDFPVVDEPRPDDVQYDAKLAFFRIVGGYRNGDVLMIWVW